MEEKLVKRMYQKLHTIKLRAGNTEEKGEVYGITMWAGCVSRTLQSKLQQAETRADRKAQLDLQELEYLLDAVRVITTRCGEICHEAEEAAKDLQAMSANAPV